MSCMTGCFQLVLVLEQQELTKLVQLVQLVQLYSKNPLDETLPSIAHLITFGIKKSYY